MRPHHAIPAIAAVLLTAACGSSASSHTLAASPSTRAPSARATLASPSGSPAASPTAGKLQVAIPAGKLPYAPAKGAPALDNVSIIKTISDPCSVPADDTGDEGQLLNAELDVNVLIITFEFTNPCSVPLAYGITVTQAIGGAKGPSGGPSTQTDTPTIAPGKSISFHVNVDPNSTLTAAQLQDLWVGVTRIVKEPAA